MSRKSLRSIAGLFVLGLLLFGGCARFPNIEKTTLTPKSYGELESYLLNRRPPLDLFRLGGPFAVEKREGHVLRLSDREIVDADLYVPGHSDKTPLVIFMHGYGSSKESHAYQAMHVASWGLYSMTLQLSPTGPWNANARSLVRIVEFVHQRPEVFGGRVDADRIILVGHSYGGAAVAIALAEKARAAGAVLLDPAGIGRDLPSYLQRIDAPVLLLGADERYSAANNRDYFFRYIRRGIAEVSVADAVHEDAQFPADDAQTTEALQITFAGAIAAASYSLALTGRFDYAWASFQDDLKNGKLIKSRKK